MSWLALLIIGIILLALSGLSFPPPVPAALRVVGAILVAFAGVLVVVGLVQTSTVDVDNDASPQVVLVS